MRKILLHSIDKIDEEEEPEDPIPYGDPFILQN